MNKESASFDQWFEVLCMALSEKSVYFTDEGSVKDWYDEGRDAFDAADEIELEYEG